MATLSYKQKKSPCAKASAFETLLAPRPIHSGARQGCGARQNRSSEHPGLTHHLQSCRQRWGAAGSLGGPPEAAVSAGDHSPTCSTGALAWAPASPGIWFQEAKQIQVQETSCFQKKRRVIYIVAPIFLMYFKVKENSINRDSQVPVPEDLGAAILPPPE